MRISNEISEYYLSDAKEYLERYIILREKASHLGNRSKLLVDLMFAFECILKSILFRESKISEKETYNKIKHHNLDMLFQLLSDKSKSEYKRYIKEPLSIYGVEIRYKMESEIKFRNEIGVLDDTYYSTIANPCWLDNIYSQIGCLLVYAEGMSKSKLDTLNFKDIDIISEIEKTKKLKDTIKKEKKYPKNI